MREQVGWRRLGLDEEEWRECQLAAMEMSIATPGAITPHQVAVEFALARAFDGDAVLPANTHARPRAARPHTRAQR